MNKTLSEQLCELCGIEPKWIKYETETSDGCINFGSKRTHPDFEKPENFVRLFNLETKSYGNCAGIINGTYFIGNTEKFIFWLIQYLKQDRNAVDELKQAISQAEWEY